MNRHPGLVSVVIPTYNRSAICRAAVESVLAQTYPNVEVIVVDDGSTDDTRDAIARVNSRVQVIWQHNAGVSAARNTGMAAARGEYIAFLDSDDRWLPWKLEAQMAVLRRWPLAGMVWTDMIAVSPTGETVSNSYLTSMYHAYRYFDRARAFSERAELGRIGPDCQEWLAAARCWFGNISQWMFMGNLVHTSTVLLRRQRADAVGGFDLSLEKSGEDYDFHLRTCRIGPVAYLDAPSIQYRVGAADQLTSPEYLVWVARNNFKTVMKFYQETNGQIGLPSALVRQRLADSHKWLGLSEFWGDRRSSAKHLISSLALRPWQLTAWAYLAASLLPRSVAQAARMARRRMAAAIDHTSSEPQDLHGRGT